jgi:hypothetical protein
MEDKYSKVELLALIKTYNKQSKEKIKNVDKMKKSELYEICDQHCLLKPDENRVSLYINLRNICKCDLKKDIEIHYLKLGQPVPDEILCLKKKELVDFMELNNIIHYTSDAIKEELNHHEKMKNLKNIIIYNIVKYDNIDVNNLDNDKLEEFICENNLDVDIGDLQPHLVLLNTLYTAYSTFCITTGRNCENDKIKSLPKIVQKLQNTFV